MKPGKEGGFKDWAELRAHAIERFNGETPHPQTEQTIIDAYTLHPHAVEREITIVANDLHNGTIRSGWGILAKRAERIQSPPSNPTGSQARRTEQVLARAEQRVRTIGHHIDRETELHEDLFGEAGMFKEHKPDARTIERLTAIWHERRAAGATLEAEIAESAAKWNAAHTCPRCGKRYPFDHCRACTRKEPPSNPSDSANSATSTKPMNAPPSTPPTMDRTAPSSPSSTPSKPPSEQSPAPSTSRTNSSKPSPASTSPADDLPL